MDHVVLLIAEKDGTMLTKKQYPHLDERAEHSDLACLHCGKYFPLSRLLPLDCGMLSAILLEFRRQHKKCK